MTFPARHASRADIRRRRRTHLALVAITTLICLADVVGIVALVIWASHS